MKTTLEHMETLSITSSKAFSLELVQRTLCQDWRVEASGEETLIVHGPGSRAYLHFDATPTPPELHRLLLDYSDVELAKSLLEKIADDPDLIVDHCCPRYPLRTLRCPSFPGEYMSISEFLKSGCLWGFTCCPRQPTHIVTGQNLRKDRVYRGFCLPKTGGAVTDAVQMPNFKSLFWTVVIVDNKGVLEL